MCLGNLSSCGSKVAVYLAIKVGLGSRHFEQTIENILDAVSLFTTTFDQWTLCHKSFVSPLHSL